MISNYIQNKKQWLRIPFYKIIRTLPRVQCYCFCQWMLCIQNFTKFLNSVVVFLLYFWHTNTKYYFTYWCAQNTNRSHSPQIKIVVQNKKNKLKKIYTTVILKVFIAPFILEFMFFFVSVHNLVAVIVVFGYNYLFQEVSFSDDFFKKKIAAFLARFLFLSIIIQYSMCQMNIEMQSISSRGTYNIRGGVRQGASKGGGRKSLLDNAANYTQLGALSKREKGSIPKPLAEIFFENLTKYKYKARL